MNKKTLWCIFVVLIVLLSMGCFVVKQNESESERQPEVVEDIVLDVRVGANGSSFEREIEPFVDVENLEKAFAFYGAYDVGEKIYSLVHKNQHYIYRYDEASQLLSNETGKIQAQVKEGKLQVNVNDFAKVLGLEVQEYAHFRLLSKDGKLKKAFFTGTAFSDYTKLKKIDCKEKEVQVVNTSEGWALIVLDNGPYLTRTENLTASTEQPLPIQGDVSQTIAKKSLVIAWDLYGDKSEQKYSSHLDIVVPSWLSLQSEQGDINDLFRPQYTANAKAQDVDLWVLINNAFNPDMTSKMLNSYSARFNFIEQIIAYAHKNPIDGINMDFENMYLKDSDLYVQLMAELHVKTSEVKLPLSVAVTVPGGSDNWSKVFDRKRLGAITEYTALMAYDQYWASSQTSGPVAGYSWVEDNINKLVEMVPRQKLLLGVPFYTRVWYESFSEEQPNSMKVVSKSVYMASPKQLINDYKPIKVWDEVHGQYYYAYFDNNRIVKFWYDDEVAIAKKAALCKKYNLAGVACWSLGFEKNTIWQYLIEAVQGQ